MQKPFDITQRTFEFAKDVLTRYPSTARSHPPSAQVWRQLIDAAGSVGANTEEAQAGSSRADFRFRIKVALREARESLFWLRLIQEAKLAGHQSIAETRQEAWELVAILTTIAKRSSSSSE